MKTIYDLTHDDAGILAGILKYDLPLSEGIKEEIIEVYKPDVENLRFGDYMSLPLYLSGLSWLVANDYDMAEVLKTLNIKENLVIVFTPPAIGRFRPS